VRRAREAVRIPDRLEKPGIDTRVMSLEIERAFAQANPGLRPDTMAVGCGRRILQEVRICLDRDLRGFRSCAEVDHDGCRADQVTVPAVR
jgi:ribonuclease T2